MAIFDIHVLDSKRQIICDTTRYHVSAVVNFNGEGRYVLLMSEPYKRDVGSVEKHIV